MFYCKIRLEALWPNPYGPPNAPSPHPLPCTRLHRLHPPGRLRPRHPPTFFHHRAILQLQLRPCATPPAPPDAPNSKTLTRLEASPPPPPLIRHPVRWRRPCHHLAPPALSPASATAVDTDTPPASTRTRTSSDYSHEEEEYSGLGRALTPLHDWVCCRVSKSISIFSFYTCVGPNTKEVIHGLKRTFVPDQLWTLDPKECMTTGGPPDLRPQRCRNVP
jgi:hypothetical protein